MLELFRNIAKDCSLSPDEIDLLIKIFGIKLDNQNAIEKIFIKNHPENPQEETKIIGILKKLLSNPKCEIIFDENHDIAIKKRSIALSLIEGTFADLYPSLAECFSPPYTKEQVLEIFNKEDKIKKILLSIFLMTKQVACHAITTLME